MPIRKGFLGISTKNPQLTGKTLRLVLDTLKINYNIIHIIIGDINNECTLRIENPDWSLEEVKSEAIRLRDEWIKNNASIIEETFKNEPEGRYKIVFLSDFTPEKDFSRKKQLDNEISDFSDFLIKPAIIKEFTTSKEFSPYSKSFQLAIEDSAKKYIGRLTKKKTLEDLAYQEALHSSKENLQTEIVIILLYLYMNGIQTFRYPVLGSLKQAFEILDKAIKEHKLLENVGNIDVEFKDLDIPVLGKKNERQTSSQKEKVKGKVSVDEFFKMLEIFDTRIGGYEDEILKQVPSLDLTTGNLTEKQLSLLVKLKERQKNLPFDEIFKNRNQQLSLGTEKKSETKANQQHSIESEKKPETKAISFSDTGNVPFFKPNEKSVQKKSPLSDLKEELRATTEENSPPRSPPKDDTFDQKYLNQTYK